jgi:uncharacterized protein (DUF305 family)
MANEVPQTKTSRKTLVTLIAIIALVLGAVAAGVVSVVQGLSGATGKQVTTVEDPWLQSGAEASFTAAMIQRNESLKRLADLALARSKNVTILAFADEMKQQAATWNFKLDNLFDVHGIERSRVVDTMSFHYKSLGELETQLKDIGDDKFDVRFVAGLNIIARMDYGNMKSDSASISSADLKALADEMLNYPQTIGPKLGNWNKK